MRMVVVWFAQPGGGLVRAEERVAASSSYSEGRAAVLLLYY